MALMRVVLGADAVVEVETAEDAVRVLQLYKQASNPPPVPLSTSVLPAQLPIRGMALKRVAKSPDRVIFKNGHYAAFEALYRATQDGIGSEQLANLLGLPSVRSLPPTISAWGKRAKSIGLELKELLEVDRGYAHGKPQTLYKLTMKGREVFRPSEKAQAV